jgi:putative ABC transport system permease protein
VDKIKEQLPRKLGQFDLTPAERAALGQALRQSPAPHVTVYSLDVPIVGVVRLAEGEERNAPGGWGWDAMGAAVLLPVRTAEDLFFRDPAQRQRGLNQATVIVDREENVEGVLKQLRGMGLEPHAPLEFIQRERLLYTLIFGAMACVAAVALLVAALGIANTMLMSVLERTREVGVMKAVGAADRHIQAIFLLEGALIGLVGGGLGLLLGWAASFPGDAWVRGMVTRDLKVELKEAIFVFPPWLLLSVMLFAVLVTTLAAVYPARRAAKVNPVSALRHE